MDSILEGRVRQEAEIRIGWSTILVLALDVRVGCFGLGSHMSILSSGQWILRSQLNPAIKGHMGDRFALEGLGCCNLAEKNVLTYECRKSVADAGKGGMERCRQIGWQNMEWWEIDFFLT